MLRAVVRIIDAISDFTGRGVAYGLIPLMVIVFLEVILRYGFNKPTIWVYETSIFLFGGVCVLAGAYTLFHHGHIRMDIFYNRLSLRGRAVVDVITSLVFFFYIIVLIWNTGLFAIMSVQTNQQSFSPWGPPLYPIKIVMVIAAFLMLLQWSAQFIRNLYYIRHGKELT